MQPAETFRPAFIQQCSDVQRKNTWVIKRVLKPPPILSFMQVDRVHSLSLGDRSRVINTQIGYLAGYLLHAAGPKQAVLVFAAESQATWAQ